MTLLNTPEIKVNGRLIKSSDIDEEMQYHPAPSRREAMIEAAKSLILEEVVNQRGKALGLFTQQEDLIDLLVEKELCPPKATNQECLQYYQTNKQKFCTQPIVEVKHILLSALPEDLEARQHALSMANDLLCSLKQDSTKFDEFAKRFSNCPSKEVGGSLGQLSHGQTVPEFQRQVFAGDKGLMNSPVESRYGYHIVYIHNKVPGRELLFEQVKDKIETYLNDKVERKAIAQYLTRLIGEADIEGFDFNLDGSQLMQ